MNRVYLLSILIAFFSLTAGAQFAHEEDPAKGTLTIRDQDVPVLTYCFGDQLKAGIDPKYTQSSYIHPLFSRGGLALTDDSPADHLHHHGLFWTWPVVKVRGLSTATWEPKLPRLRQFFVRWLKREAANGISLLRVENAWKLDGKETVAKEIVALRIHPAEELGRAVDLELTIEAAGGRLELQGTLDQNKGYGGLCIRGAPLFTGAAMTTDQGPLKEDAVHTPFRWADLSTRELGFAVFVPPDHPDFPPKWMIRNSYAGLINVSWPGLTPVILEPGRPVVLRYRVFIHDGDASAGKVTAAYEAYATERPSLNPLSSALPHQGGGITSKTPEGGSFYAGQKSPVADRAAHTNGCE
jgi:hypothetical protein